MFYPTLLVLKLFSLSGSSTTEYTRPTISDYADQPHEIIQTYAIPSYKFSGENKIYLISDDNHTLEGAIKGNKITFFHYTKDFSQTYVAQLLRIGYTQVNFIDT